MSVFILVLVSPGSAGSQFVSTPNYLPEMFQRWPTVTATAQPGYLLITEVMYDPDGSEPGAEWVEVFNPGGTAVDLQFYKLGTRKSWAGRKGCFSFRLVQSWLPVK